MVVVLPTVEVTLLNETLVTLVSSGEIIINSFSKATISLDAFGGMDRVKFITFSEFGIGMLMLVSCVVLVGFERMECVVKPAAVDFVV